MEEDFHTNYFEKKALLIQRNDPEYFSSLLTMSDMADYLERKDTVYPHIRMVKDGIQLPNELYTKNTIIRDQVIEVIDNEKLFSLFEDGASVVCQQLQITFPVLYEFTRLLSNYFKLNVGLNTYLTPAVAQAFDPHYDTHDVFILQVYGSKMWRLYDMPVPSPIKKFDKKTWAMPEPTLEVELKQGDTLYIPRGLVHDATTASNTSLHITMGLSVETWVDIFNSINLQSASIESFRKTFNWSQVTEEELKNTIHKLALELVENVDYNKLLADIKQKHERVNYEVHSGRFNDLLNHKNLDNNSVVFLRKQAITRLTEDVHSINLAIRDKDVKFRLSEKSLINEMLITDQFSIGEMQTKYTGLSVLKAVKTLIKHGVLGIKS